MGTRLGHLTETLPKPMVLVEGRPFIEHEIELLRVSGVKDLVLCVGYLGEEMERHLGDGRRLGVRIAYSFDGPKLLGPAGALGHASRLLEESFFVTYGDVYLRADYGRIMQRLLNSEALGVMAVYRNYDRYGRSDLVVRDGYVVRYDKKRHARNMSWINYGVSALKKPVLRFIPRGLPRGEQEFYGELIRRRELLSFSVRKRFYEIGTPSALDEFSRFIRAGTEGG